MIKVVSFDLDGTIGDTLPMCIAAFRQAISPYLGHELSLEEIEKTFGLNETGMVKQILGQRWKPALEDFYTLYERLHDSMARPYPEMTEVFRMLKEKHVATPLVTGKGAYCCAVTLQKFDMLPYFDEIITGREDRPHKKDALSQLMRDFAAAPDEILYVGDAVSDVEACEAIGIRCLSAAWSKDAKLDKLQSVNAPYVYRTIAEFKAALLLLIR